MKELPLTTFASLGLAPNLLKALTEEGYTTPTPIQAQAIPVVLKGVDLLGIAQTGTGKTAAFALPILQRLAADHRPPVRKSVRVLVLSPTRELASQIAESFRTYGRHHGVSVGIVFGGVAQGPQRSMLARGVDVLVATPGRLLDHLQQGSVDLKGAEVLVLDEADQMLDLGFLPPIRRIVARLSSKRQTLFFSATMPPEIGKLASEFLRDPVKVSVAPSATTVERVEQKVILIEQSKKRSLLVELFADPAMARTLVFTRTKRGADKVAAHLEAAGIEVAAIHGNKSQNQREQALAAFKASKIRALVATDIAARGIDVDQVSHVVNFELPDVPDSYVHRIGRTARAGAAGVAISLVDSEERSQLRDIERLTRQSISSQDRRNDAALVADKTPVSARERGVRSGRPGGERRGPPQGRGAPRGAGGRDRGQHRRPERDNAPAAHAEEFGAVVPNRPARSEDRASEHAARGKRDGHRGNQRPDGATAHRGSNPRGGEGRTGNRQRAEAKPDTTADRIHPARDHGAKPASGRQDNQRNGIRFRNANAKAPGPAHGAPREKSSRNERGHSGQQAARPASAELSGLGFMRRSNAGQRNSGPTGGGKRH